MTKQSGDSYYTTPQDYKIILEVNKGALKTLKHKSSPLYKHLSYAVYRLYCAGYLRGEIAEIAGVKTYVIGRILNKQIAKDYRTDLKII